MMLFFGAANIVNFFKPGTIPTIVPNDLERRAVNYMRSFGGGTSYPAVVFVGTLVGLHNFPCACRGGIYMTFLGLISSSPFFLQYLLAYNAVFVAPLVAILLLCSSKAVVLRFREWRQTNESRDKLFLGVLMMVGAAIILGLLITGMVQ
ncbi:MAG: hypothetical protein HYU03_00210 [Thaumarchaeota archaeon]|nr:hypothetical protein [Nitrososphaerota archaeon]